MNRLRHILPFALFPVVVVCAQIVMRATETEYCLTQLTMAVYYAIVVMGLCLLMGYAGQVSLGHGAFFAIGGYTSAVLTTHSLSGFKNAAWAAWLERAHLLVAKPDLYGNAAITVSPWAAFLAAMLITFFIALLIGYPALRLRGHYLAMATLGFGLIVSKMLLGSTITGSADGINGVPEWKLVAGLTVTGKSAARVQNYYIACGLAFLLLLFLRNLVHSRVGRALQAIHDRETAANAMGINTAASKLKVFVLSALLASIAGVFFTHYTGGIGPSEAGALKSVRYVALAAAGGMANLWGVTIMSTALNYFSLRGWFGSYDNAVFGAILILIISLAPEGPLKPLGLWLKRLMGKRPASPTSGGTDHVSRFTHHALPSAELAVHAGEPNAVRSPSHGTP
jgi:branched-chain amino acid transport system permease protein